VLRENRMMAVLEACFWLAIECGTGAAVLREFSGPRQSLRCS
jgi:hypothetical protein